MSDALDELIEKEVAQWQFVQTTTHFWTLVTPLGYIKGPMRFANETELKKWIRKQAVEAVQKRIGEDFP